MMRTQENIHGVFMKYFRIGLQLEPIILLVKDMSLNKENLKIATFFV